MTITTKVLSVSMPVPDQDRALAFYRATVSSSSKKRQYLAQSQNPSCSAIIAPLLGQGGQRLPVRGEDAHVGE